MGETAKVKYRLKKLALWPEINGNVMICLQLGVILILRH